MGLEGFLRAGGSSLADVTGRIVLALFVPSPPWLDGVYGPAGALCNPEEAARWISGLQGASPTFCVELLTSWLIRWRVGNGSGMLAEVGRIVAAATPQIAQEVGRAVLEVLDRAAPPASSADRPDWFLSILREVRPRLGMLFPSADAAALVMREGILPALGAEETAELAPVLAARDPEAIFAWLEQSRASGALVSEAVLLPFLLLCRDGILEHWDLEEQPVRWDLVGEVAVQATALIRTGRSRSLSEDLVWLLWAASRLISEHGKLPGDKVYRQLEAALNALLEVRPEGLTDLVLEAVYRLSRFGRGFQRRIPVQELVRARERAWEDAQGESPSDDAFFFFLMRLAYLDRELFQEIGA
jgi:hypothetical protein